MGKLRRAIASFSIVAILSSFVLTTSVSAQVHTFNDVPAWTTVYVDALIPSGAITNKSGTFRPADNVVRAEAFKMVDLAIGFERGALGSWPDVKEADWYYGHIQDLFGAGVVKGAADGMMYPGNAINRAEAAKLVVEASGVTCADSETTNKFSDVAAGQWYTKYVACGVREGWFNGYADGTFRPANFINRAEFAKLAAVSADLAEPTEETPVTPATGDVTVRVSADTPDTASVPSGAASVEFAAFDFTAGDEDAVINELTVTRKGVISDSAFDGVYLYHEDGTRLTSQRSINSDDHTVTFSSLGVEVDAGKTVTLWVRADMEDVASEGDAYFQIASAEMVELNGDGTVGGSFPLSGEPMNVKTTDAGTVVVTKSGTINNPTLGEVAKLAEFRLEVDGEDGELEEISLTVKGSANAASFKQLELRDQAGEVVATSEGVSGSEDLAVFVFDEPYMIEEGESRVFRFYAQVLGSDAGDDIQVYVKETTDVQVIGGDFGFGLTPTITAYNGDTCADSGDPCSFSEVEAGDFTLAFNGPVARDVALDGRDIHLLEFSMTASNEVSVEGMDFILYADDDDNDPFDAVEGGADNDDDGLGGATEANLTDIKVVDLDSGSTVLSAEELTISGDYDDADQTISFTDSFVVEAGETRNFALTVDTTDAAAFENTEIGATLDISGLSVEDSNGDELADDEIAPGADMVGRTMTVIDAGLLVSISGTPSSGEYVQGSDLVSIVGLNFQATDAEAVTVNQLTVSCYVDTDAGDDFADALGADDLISNLYLYVDGEKVAGPKRVETDGSVLFENLNWELDASKTKKIIVKADLATVSGITDDLLGCGIEEEDDVVAQDVEGDTVEAEFSGDTNTLAELIADGADAVIITVQDSGSLTVSVEENPTEETLLVAGSEDVLVTKYRFNAIDEDFLVNDLDVVMLENDTANANAAETTYQRAYNSVSLKYTDADGTVVTEDGNFNSGEANFTGLNMLVPKDSSAYLEIYVDLNTIQGDAVSGDDIRVAIQDVADNTANNFEAIGVGSDQTLLSASAGLTLPANADRVEPHVLRETVPTVSYEAPTGTFLVNGQNKFYKFTVEADDAEVVSMSSVRLRTTFSTDGDGAMGLFQLFRGSTNITDDVTIVASGDPDAVPNGTDLTAAGAIDEDFDGYVVVTWDDEEDVSAGSTQSYEVRATATSIDDAADSFTAYIEDDLDEVVNFISAYALFDYNKIKVGTDNGTADYIFYDTLDDTTADDGAVCENVDDDIALAGASPADCELIADATLTRIKVLDSGVIYDAANDSVANDGGACTNAGDNIVLGGGAADCGNLAAITLGQLFYVYEDDGGRTIFYDEAGDTTEANDAACGGNADDFALGDAVADCGSIAGQGSSVFNFLWSDNSASNHSIDSEDWTNGYLVDDLQTDPRTLAYNS